MPKKFLIITEGFYPVQSPRSFRATELAKELCRQGHEVSVMAPERPNMEPLLSAYPIKFISLGKITWVLPSIKGMGKIGALFNKVTTRLLVWLFEYPMIELYFKTKKKLRDEHNKYDAVISVAVPYPIHWGVAAAWSNNKEKNVAPIWIADCGDPYCLQENDTFKTPFYFTWVEKWFSRKTNFITVPTQNSVKGYFPEFHSKIKVIPQGFKFEDVQLYTGELPKEKIVFGYAGMFIPGRRDPSEFLEYINNLPDNYNVEFHVYTINPQFVTPFIKDNDRIILKDLVSRETLLFELSKMNFVVNFENVGSTQTPSKLIDYLIINKPVLSVRYGDLKPAVINEFLNGNYIHKMELPDKERYRIQNVTNQFLELL